MSCPKKLAAAEAPSRARRRVHSGDILVSTVRPNLRGFARVREAPKNLIAPTGFAVLTPMSDVDGSYVYHHVMTQQFADYLEKATTGQAYPAVRPADVTNFVLPIPSLPEQRAIAAVLDSIDDAIERTQAVIAATGQLRDSLLHQLLTRGIPGWHTEWKEVPGLGTIPADWEVVRLGEVAEVNRSNWDPAEGSTILYLDLPAVDAPGVLSAPRELDAADTPSRARRRVRSGDILVSTVRPKLRGFARVSKAPKNLVASTGFAVVSPGLKVNGSFAYHHVMTNQFAQYLENATTGQAYPAVRPRDVADFRLPLPPLPEQEAMAELLDGVDVTIAEAKRERDGLQLLKASAADALLTGRVHLTMIDDKGDRSSTECQK